MFFFYLFIQRGRERRREGCMEGRGVRCFGTSFIILV